MPLIYAHRGSAILAPENTRAAFDLAIRHQADVLETDIRTSRDGVPVIHHDAKVDRTGNSEGFVSNFTLAELKKLDMSGKFTSLADEPWQGEAQEILTLEEFLSEYHDMPVSLEIKHPKTEFAATVADVIYRVGKPENITVASFHDDVSQAFRVAAPDIKTAAARDEISDFFFSRRTLSRWLNYLHERLFEPDNLANNGSINFQTLQIPTHFKAGPVTFDLCDRDFIAYAKSRKLPVNYWTINTTEALSRLAQLGADGLITDRVDIAEKLFK